MSGDCVETADTKGFLVENEGDCAEYVIEMMRGWVSIRNHIHLGQERR